VMIGAKKIGYLPFPSGLGIGSRTLSVGSLGESHAALNVMPMGGLFGFFVQPIWFVTRYPMLFYTKAGIRCQKSFPCGKNHRALDFRPLRSGYKAPEST
jgi:hypothetical protein